MANIFPPVEFPELFFGFVSPIGVDLRPILDTFTEFLHREEYDVQEIRITDLFIHLSKIVKGPDKLVPSPEDKRYLSYIGFGNHLRKESNNDAILAELTVARIAKIRNAVARNRKSEDGFKKTAYLLHQFKRKEEIDLLRDVYSDLFFQVSIYSRRGSRVDYLARRFAKGVNSADANRFRSEAESLVRIDENEVESEHGQRVAKIFHDADFIVNTDISKPTPAAQIERFCEALFSSNCISPTKQEYGMFLAAAAALRTTDLSRQVGAAIFSKRGEVICLGSNEVPKASGGTYWSDEDFDDREYKRGFDSNDKRKRELLLEVVSLATNTKNAKKKITQKSVKDSQFMDALEYGRIVHAEMSALSDAARLGRAVKDSILYCTTFPCHMCAKHIVASGVDQVVFLEPYPKSLAVDLHSDSVEVEGSDRGPYEGFPSVRFEHFYGITPRRYRELFQRGKRKDDNLGQFQRYIRGKKKPLIQIIFPFYIIFEEEVIPKITKKYLKALLEMETAREEETKSSNSSLPSRVPRASKRTASTSRSSPKRRTKAAAS